MDYWDKKLIREQLSRKLEKLKSLRKLNVPSVGWIKTIRESLGMTTYELAERADVDQSRISRIESAESRGEIKLSTLKNIADALGMQFVYGFVPEKDLEQMVREQAKKVALERMDRLNHTMKLEKQGLDEEERKKALEDMIEKILVEDPQNFWRE